MSHIRELRINLTDWETRAILESVSKEMERLKHINATSQDEDEAADAGNDLLELSCLWDRLCQEAISIFGEQIKNFNQEEL